MTLGDRQKIFTQNIGLLIDHAYRMGFALTFGEVYRTIEQQKIYFDSGRSKTMNSRHLQKLAADFNIFDRNGRMLFPSGQSREDQIKDLEATKVIADFWIVQNPDNVWGADWNRNHDSLDESFLDPYHFEMKPA